MKKVLALVMALMLVLSLVACGGGGKTKEEMLSEAKKLCINTLFDEIDNNTERAKSDYENGTYLIWGQVYDIKGDHCVISTSYCSTICSLNVFLPKDELLKLNKDEAIQIVGKITKISNALFKVNIDVKNAYFVTDEYEIKNANVDDITYSRITMEYECRIDDENFQAITISTGKITNAQRNKNNGHNFKVSASGKMKYDSNKGIMMDDSNFTISEK